MVPVVRLIVQTLVVLLLFSLNRMALFWFYKESVFKELNSKDVFWGFLHGIRFDLSAILTFLGLPILMMVLPGKMFYSKGWQKLWNWIYFAVAAVLILLLCGDFLYFGHVSRHVFDEVMLLGNDVSFLSDGVLNTYLPYTIALSLFLVVMAFSWKLIFHREIKRPVRSWLSLVLVILTVALGIRGSVGMKPINIVDGFITDKTSSGLLVLNGVFTAWHSSRSSSAIQFDKFEEKELEAALRPYGIDPRAAYPFLREFKGKDKKYNIVLILLESWGAYYIDSFGGNDFGATPYFDSYAKDGIKFDNFYATGSRSIEALQTIMTGFPALKGMPTLGIGFESFALTRLGKLFSDRGYETLFAQSSKRRSFRLDSIANAVGFKHYYGAEDFPRLLDYPKQKDPLFGWDYEMMMFVGDKIEKTNKNFFIMMFTGTTHTPFAKTPNPLLLKGHGPDNEVGYLNTMHYSDWSLGQFMERAKEKPWFNDTIFVMTADHTFPSYREFNFIERHKVPLLIYAPGIFSSGNNNIVGSHLNLLSTLLDLSGYEGQVAVSADSLLSPSGDEFVFLSGRFGNPAIITHDAFLRHTTQKRLEYKAWNDDCNEQCFSKMEKFLLGYNQLLHTSIRNNRWMTPLKK